MAGVIVNARAQITYCNEYFTHLTGWSFAELAGRPWREVFVLPLHDEILASSQPVDLPLGWRFENDILTRSGERRSIRWNNLLLRDAIGQPVAAAGIGEDVTEQKKVARALMDCNARERCSLGRDLHDGLGQDLAGIALLAKSLATSADRDRLQIAQDLARLSTIASNAIESCRKIAREFSPSSDLQGGLLHALKQLTIAPPEWRGPSIAFVVCQTAPLALTADASDHVYRIAQEWLADTVRHAAAKSIIVSVNVHPSAVRLEIIDDGVAARGLTGTACGNASEILQHRAALLEAHLLVEPRPTGGSRLALVFGQPA